GVQGNHNQRPNHLSTENQHIDVIFVTNVTNSKPLYFYCNKIWLIYKLHWGKKLSGMFLRSKASSRIAFAKTQERSPLHQYS
ncbi:hypothetical protein, partial [Escherichia coli]